MSTTATTSTALPRSPFSTMALKTRRPILPKPLMPTRTVMTFLLWKLK